MLANEVIPYESKITESLVKLVNNQLLPPDSTPLNQDSDLLMIDIFDSLTMVSLLSYIEKHFKVKVPDQEITPDNFRNFNSIANLIASLEPLDQDKTLSHGYQNELLLKAIKIVESDVIESRSFTLSNGDMLHTLHVKGAKTTWLLLPGLGNPSSSWASVLHALSDDFEAYAIDLNGFGISSPTSLERPNFSLHYQAMDDLISQINASSYVLVGSSAGSMIAMEMARRHPSKIKALVITGFGLIDNPKSWWQNLSNLSLEPQNFLHAAYYRPPELNDSLHSLVKDVMSRPAYWSFLENGGLDEMKRVADNITVPTLFVNGEEDQIIPKAAVEAAQAKIDGSRVEWLSRCGHFPPVEQPEELVYIIKGFIDTL